MNKHPRPWILMGLLAGTTLLGASGEAHARERAASGDLQPVTMDLATLYCRAEGEWCPPLGEPAPMEPAEVSALDLPGPVPTATPKRVAVRAELAMEVPEIPGLQPVAADAAAVVCYTEGAWCGLLPADQQPVFEPGL